MKLPDSLRDMIGELRHRTAHIRDQWRQSQHTTVLHLVRPQLGDTPRALRPVLEPLVAIGAATALAGLVGAGVISMAAFLVAVALIYAILTYVFGIDIAMRVPTTGF